jgi:hypothetical protein
MATTPAVPGRTRAVESLSTWRRGDRIALALCWAAGIALCLIAAAIVLYMLFKGIQTLRPALLAERPAEGASQREAGGFLDPLVGTVVLTVMGTALAVPLGVARRCGSSSTVARTGSRARSSRGSRSSPARRRSSSRSSASRCSRRRRSASSRSLRRAMPSSGGRS